MENPIPDPDLEHEGRLYVVVDGGGCEETHIQEVVPVGTRKVIDGGGCEPSSFFPESNQGVSYIEALGQCRERTNAAIRAGTLTNE